MLPMLALLSLSWSSNLRQDTGAAPVPREFRAAWVATVANIDWPSAPGLTSDVQKNELLHILDTAVSLKLNAIILQVRPACDALYDSKLEPWSEYLTGAQGKPPTPFYDPLKFAVEEAHSRGLELHCWFNPYRAGHPAQKGPLAKNHIKNIYPNLVKKYGSYLWLDPGEPLVQSHSLAVIKDVVKRYDIDGVHIDDYFYPYREGDKDFPDESSYRRYVQKGGTLAKDDWRRDNVNTFVHGIYTTIKKEKPWVKFGISPFGIYRPGNPSSIKAGVDQYAELYADCKKWLNEGWCDYLSPQLYWPIAQKAQSFPVLLDWWISENTKGRHIWPGLYTSRVASDEGKTWNLKEILDQISARRDRPGSTGEIHFSMKAFLLNAQNITRVLSEGLYAHRALVPASPWLSEDVPVAPVAKLIRNEEGKWVVNMHSGNRKPIRFYMVRVKLGRWLEPHMTSDESLKLSIDASVKPDAISVTAIDRVGNQSPESQVEITTLNSH